METYVVTERAGPKVAGRRVKPGDELALSEAEAAHELREGSLVKKGATLDAAYSADSDALKALRRAARGEREPAPASDTAAVETQTPLEPASKAARKGKSE